jgi:flap endonuclease-1
LILACVISEERVRKGAEKLAKSMNTKQQGRLDGFFTATPKTSAPKKAPAKDAKGKDDKGKGAKRKVSSYPALTISCRLYRLTYQMKTEDKDEAKPGKKSKAKK